MRTLVEDLCGQGVDVAVVSGTHVGNVDGQLRARPTGPGRLLLALNRGSELFEVGAYGPTLLSSRVATPEEDEALDRSAAETVARLAARGLEARIVSQRLNRRKIDLIPVPEWADPPKSEIDRLLDAVEARLAAVGIAGIGEVAAIAESAAHSCGLAEPKITSDAKHVEIGLTDKADSARAVLAELWRDGISAELVLIGGDEFGELGGMPGSDSLMLVPQAARATVLSVGREPGGIPPGIVHRAGGPAAFVETLRDQLRRRADVPAVADEPAWSLTVEGVDPERERAAGALLTIADGMIGTTGAPLLAYPDARAEVVAGGLYDGQGPATDLLTAPLWATLPGALGPDDIVRRVLDLHTGVLGEQVRGDVTVESIRFSSLADPGIAVLRADLQPPGSGPALVAGGGATAAGELDGRAWATSTGTGGAIGAAARQVADGSRVERVVAYEAASDPAVAREQALARVDAAAAAGFERLLREHRSAWARRWDRADVVIEGDDDLQRRIRVALYHLMAAAADRGESAVGARGLSGHAYRGHVFWDADLFVLPFLAATHPASARAMLEYRLRRLPAALTAARAEGRAGARFPWESAASGVDVTPHAGRDRTGRVVPIRTGADEVHIVGDIAWAAWCYASWTGDEDFVRGPGCELLVETARYWASRVHFDRSGFAHLFGVIGPDEYHEPVDDNAFTNVLARWNLRTAADWVERDGDGSVAADEIARWRSVAGALVDGLDPLTGIYEQFAGFYGLEPLLIADIAPRRPITADLLLGRDRVRAAQVVKQADVLMLYHLLPDEVPPGSLGPNLDYYERRTAHGSSLSPGIHASLFARVGRVGPALDLLRIATALDVDDLTRTGAGGVHLAAMGSVWQALAFGFAGIRPRAQLLVVDPHLPASWKSLELRLQFRGARLAIGVYPDHLAVVTDMPVALEMRGRRVDCAPGTNRIACDTRGART